MLGRSVNGGISPCDPSKFRKSCGELGYRIGLEFEWNGDDIDYLVMIRNMTFCSDVSASNRHRLHVIAVRLCEVYVVDVNGDR